MTLVKLKNGQLRKSPYTDIFGSIFDPEPYFPKSLVSKVPAVNISETDEGFYIELAVPGLKREDIKISVENEQLIISSAQPAPVSEESEEKKYTRKEFSYLSFRRSFNLPESADQNKIDANYTNGVLYVAILKKEETKPQVKEIEVK